MRKFQVLVILLLLLTACGSREAEPRFVNIRGVAFGTYYSISYYCNEGVNYAQDIDSLFADFNQSLSYYVQNSVISRINRNETNIADDYFMTVLQRSLEIAKETGGAFDPTVGPLVNAWGFGFQERKQMTPAVIDSLKRITGYQKVTMQGNRIIKEIPEIQFDFNAIAKGYASDLAAAYLESKGIETMMVEIGGDLVARGLKPDGTPWRIGLEVPAEDMYAEQEWEFLVKLHNRAVATSGNYRKYYEVDGQKYSHTIDPVTGKPVTHNLLSVTVFAHDCMTADAFATAFMVMGLEDSKEFLENRTDMQAFFIFSAEGKDYATFQTPGIDIIPRSELE